MQKITSFTIDHLKLQPGVYVSRKDPVGDSLITTFDIRMTLPQRPRHCGLAAARKFDPCNFIPASPPCPAPSFCTHFKTAK